MRLAVFDVDGTLVDSQHSIVSAMDAAFVAVGLPAPAPEATRRVIGLSLMEAVARLMPGCDRETVVRATNAYKDAFRALRLGEDHADPLFPGVLSALDALERRGVLLGVATGKSRRGLLAFLERHGLMDRFVTLQTADEGPGKPHPAMLLRAMNEAGTRAAHTTMIGDTTYDMGMALSARTHAVGVSWGYHGADELVRAGARLVLDRFDELPRFVAPLKGEESPSCASRPFSRSSASSSSP